MKKVMSAIVVGIFLLSQTGLVGADTFGVGATVPAATSVSIFANNIPATGPDAGIPDGVNILSGSSLTFNNMAYNSDSIFLPDNFYHIVVVPQGSVATSMVTTVSYTEGANPNGVSNGLGSHATATFVEVQGNT